MLKKCLMFIFLIIMILSATSTGMVCLAEEYPTTEFLFNGDMEWDGTSYTSWNKHEYSTDITYGGSTKSAMFRTTADNADTKDTLECRIIVAQNISGLIGGQKYTVSYHLYRDVDFEDATVMNNHQSLTAGAVLRPCAGMKLEYKDANGAPVGSESFDSSYPTTTGEWQKFEFTTIAIPANATAAVVHMRSQGIGTMYMDNLSIIGACTAETKASKEDLRARCQKGYEMSEYFYNKSLESSKELQLFGDNYVQNPGFEKQSFSFSDLKYKLDIWKTVNIEGVASRSTADKKSENASLLINVPDNYSGSTNPYTYQRINPPSGETTFIAGAKYYVSAWVKTVDAPYGAGAFFGIKAYTPENQEFGQESHVLNTYGEWQQLVYIYTMPENIQHLDLYIRCHRSKMQTYFDDVVFGRASSTDPLTLSTKHTFNYSEDGDIIATSSYNTTISPIESGSKIRYTLSDENGTAVASTEVATAASTEWAISPSLMIKKAKYILKAEYIDPIGNVNTNWTKTKNIYLFDRPKTLDANGNLLDGDIINGEFVPNGNIVPVFFNYRWVGGRHDEFANAGFTVVRVNAQVTLEELDELHALGMKAIVKLYGTDPVGHPRQYIGTAKTVNRLKDHPAVCAYMLMDEPTKQVSTTYIRTYDEMLYYLEEGYRQIRTIDDIHPIYVIESHGDYADGYERTSQMCDIFAIDPYPSSVSNAISGHIAKMVTHARKAVSDERPVWALGLAANGWSGDYGVPANYGSTMLRYQLYDALWAGAQGAGHYVMATDTMPDGTSYEDIYLDTFKAAKASGEIDEIYDHFLLGNSKIFNEGKGNGYQWRAWYKDNGDIYLAVRSKIADDGKTVFDAVTTDFNLVSSNVKFSIDGFDATLINGTSEQTVSSVTNNFSCTIKKGEVSLYKITPVEDINIKNINAGSGTILPLEYGEELIANGDAESGDTPGYNTSQGSTNFSRTSSNKANGTYSFMITPKNGGSPQYRATNIPIEFNSHYEFSFNMYSDYFTETLVPTIWLYYQDANKADIKCIKLYMPNAALHSGEWQKYTYILPSYVPESTEPEAEYVSMQIKIPAEISSIYFDDVSLRKVTTYNEENLLSNASFEQFDVGATIRSWVAGNIDNVSLSADTHKDICSIGVSDTYISSSAPVAGGKTYLFTTWFNAKSLTNSASYPALKVQIGDFVSTTDFTDAFDKKELGWYKLTTEVTIPDSVAENAPATVSLVMNGSDIGYFDDASFKLSRPGYTLRNLSTSANSSSISVAYDINNHFTEEGGTIIYAFYDADGRLVKMEKEIASFNNEHISRTFEKVDFAKIKVFIWDSVTGMSPYSNMIE